MQYAKVRTPARKAFIALEPTNWEAPYQKLFDQTDVSGYEVWLAESSNNFSNAFQRSSEQRFKKRRYWAEIFRDIVQDGGRGTDDKKRLNLNYISHAGTEWEKSQNIWAPKSGFYVPTNEGIFVPGTLVPFETVQGRKEAMTRLEAKGIPREQVSYFYRLGKYDSNRFVGRLFNPSVSGYGRFLVDANWLPSRSGGGGVASRPAYGKHEVVMEVSASEEVKAK